MFMLAKAEQKSTSHLKYATRNRLSARLKVQTVARRKLTRADAFTRWWVSVKQCCEIQCEVLEFSEEQKWLGL